MTIRSDQQLKAFIRNMGHGDSAKAQILMRSYAVERFLVRVSHSRYRDKLVLKGGTLVAAIVGIDLRSTMDIDHTVKGVALTRDVIRMMIEELSTAEEDDGATFSIGAIHDIREGAQYSGIRVNMEAQLGRIRIPMKLDFTTGDVLTPGAIEFDLELVFDEGSISLLAYNTETLLAEKLETVLSRGSLNTRMRDYYDICLLDTKSSASIDRALLTHAVHATCEKRGTRYSIHRVEAFLEEVCCSDRMSGSWELFRQRHPFVGDMQWDTVLCSVATLLKAVSLSR